jgi:hypothetical protein
LAVGAACKKWQRNCSRSASLIFLTSGYSSSSAIPSPIFW